MLTLWLLVVGAFLFSYLFFGYLYHFFQILAVGAEPFLSRFDMNGDTLSQIQCVPQSAFSISLHPSGVCSFQSFILLFESSLLSFFLILLVTSSL